MPDNVFGPGDDFSPGSSHVIPTIISSNAPREREPRQPHINMGTRSSKKGIPVRGHLANAYIYLRRDYSSFDPINWVV